MLSCLIVLEWSNTRKGMSKCITCRVFTFCVDKPDVYHYIRSMHFVTITVTMINHDKIPHGPYVIKPDLFQLTEHYIRES